MKRWNWKKNRPAADETPPKAAVKPAVSAEKRPEKKSRFRFLYKGKQAAVRHQEGLRTIAAGLLIAAMIGQCGWLWSNVLELDSTPRGTLAHGIARWVNSSNTGEQADTTEPAAYPVKLAVRTETGTYGIQYSGDGMATEYAKTEDMWSAALKNAEKFRQSSQAEYTNALKNPMVFLEFDGSVPLSLIAGWMGAQTPKNGANLSCGGLMLEHDTDGSYLVYVRDASSGAVFCADTTLTDVQFDSVLEQFETNDCTMAADTNTSISPDTLQFSEEQSFDTVVFSAYSGDMTALLETWGIDGQSAQETAYAAKDGTAVYVEGDTTVRVTDTGVLSYQSDTGVRAYRGGLKQEDARQKCAQLGRTLSESLLEGMNSGGEAHLSKAYTDGNGRYVTVFTLRVDGVPVDNELGYFARYEFDGGVMVAADVVLRACEVTGGVVAVMPETVAAAAGSDEAAILSLRYTDSAQLVKFSQWSADNAADSTGETANTVSGMDTWQEAGQTDSATTDETTTDSWTTGQTDSTTTGTTTDTTADTDAQREQNNEWIDSSTGSASDSTTGTGQNAVTAGGEVAQAQWKFLLYQTENQDAIPDLVPGERPDLTACHMPDFLTPLGRGGTEG